LLGYPQNEEHLDRLQDREQDRPPRVVASNEKAALQKAYEQLGIREEEKFRVFVKRGL